MKVALLIDSAKEWMNEKGFTKSTIYCNFIRFWNDFEKTSSDTEYSYSSLEKYILSKYGSNILQVPTSSLAQKISRAAHALQSLDDFAQTGRMGTTSMNCKLVRQPLTDTSQRIFEDYIAFIDSHNYANNTKRIYKGIIHTLLMNVPYEEFSRDRLLKYMQSLGYLSKATASNYRKCLKNFFRYLFDAEKIQKDYCQLILSSRKRRGTEIPSVYSVDEVIQLINYLSSNGKVPLRNRAIAVLIAVCGIRAGDVANLLIENIDWENSKINFIQHKTNIPMTIKLTPVVGNCLVEYLLKERPNNAGDNHLFLTESGTKMNSVSISSAICLGFVNCGININGRKHGSHSLRHTLASTMLEEGKSILEISKALGHDSIDSSKYYAKVDFKHLKLCELEVQTDE